MLKKHLARSGTVIGVVAIALVLIALFTWWMRRRRDEK
jgi:hypothetical protein